MPSIPSPKPVTRRRFLQASAAAGAVALGCPAFVRSRSPNDKLNLAFIGTGRRGAHNLGQFKGENVVALCDVDEANLLLAAESAPKAKKFRDFRILCVYGTREKNSLCRELDVPKLELPGGHHFGGHYAEIGAAILNLR